MGPRDLESHPYGGRMSDSRWEQLTRLFSNEAKTEAITTTSKSHTDMDLRERLSHYGHQIFRTLDRRLFLISAVVLFGITVVILELAHLQPGRTAAELAGDEQDPTLIEPEYCTTWPVGSDNQTYIPIARDGVTTQSLKSVAPEGGWKKPEAIKVVGLIFYGRRRNVDILDCYLLQNLANNGGYLDEVRFIMHTKQEKDLAYLDQLISQREYYHIVDVGDCKGWNYSCMWDKSTDNNTIYLKIDDDITYIHPDAIPQLVHTRIAEPHPFVISANLVNSPLTGSLHYYFGAIHPLVPENSTMNSTMDSTMASFPAAETWRQSEKPMYPLTSNSSNSSEPEADDLIFPPTPYRGHTWLSISNDSYDLLKTPMGVNSQHQDGPSSPFGNGWRSWAIAAQQHYSLLINLERNEIARYFFGSPIPYPGGKNVGVGSSAPASSNSTDSQSTPGAEQLYDTQYVRYNLNFIAIWGHDVKASLPMAEDDEQTLTVTVPKRLKRPVAIDTRAVVSHFSFYPQSEGIRETDILDRYRAYANEMVCKPDNLKSPFDGRCEGFWGVI